MRFETPTLLALSLLILPIVWFAVRSRAPQTGGQKFVATSLACLAVLLLAAALAGPLATRTAPITRIAIAAGAADAQSRIDDWRDATPYDDPFHVVTAGAQPTVGARGVTTAATLEGAPDLAAALRVAAALVPPHDPGEILVLDAGLSDGDDVRSLIPELVHRGIAVHRRTARVAPSAPRLIAAEVPAQANEHAPVRVTARIESATEETVRLVVRSGERVLAESDVALRRGAQAATIDVEPEGRGAVTLTVEIVRAGVVDAAIGRETVALWIDGKPRVLHLSVDSGVALRATLAPQVDVVTRNPEGGVSDADLAACDLVIVDDLPASSWPEAAQRTVRDAVLDRGLGLWLAGAYRNLGPGGYAQSPLADVLPVELPQREEHRDPSVAVVVILDTSGSMGGTRIELAKEVARLAMRRLQPHDKIGIVEFYGSKRWAAPLQSASNLIEVQRALNRLQAGGGTIIYSAIEESYYALLNARTRFKHVLVLTDGGVESGPFEVLARKMAEAGINVNTVLIGPQASSPFLMDLAQWGRGRFYAAPSRFQLPDLRFKEPQSSPLPAVQERALSLQRAGAQEATAALDGAPLPAALGYVEIKPRPGAESWITGEGDRTFVAAWDQGLGRVVVQAGELLGPFAADLRNEPRWRSLLVDMARAVARSKASQQPRLERRIGERGVELTLRDLPGPTWPLPTVTIADATPGAAPGATTNANASANAKPEPMWPAEAGTFRTFVPWPAGAPASVTTPLLVDVAHERLGTPLRTALVPPGSRAARAATVETALAALPRATRGSIDGAVPVVAVDSATTTRSLAPLFALLAGIAWFLAVLVRRLPARVPAMAALLFVWLPMPVVAQDATPPQGGEDPAAIVQAELKEKGHLDDLKVRWKDGTPQQRSAIARAEGDLATVLQLLPDTAEHRTERALLLESQGRLGDAIKLYDAMLVDEREPLVRAGMLLRRGELKFASRDRDGGIADFRAAATTANVPELTRRIGLLAGSLRQPQLAVELAGEGTTTTDFLRLATWHEEAADLPAARKALDRAYELAKLQRDRRFVLARTIRLARKTDTLSALADEWRAAAEDDPAKRFALLWVWRELGRGADALALLERHGGQDARAAEQALAIAVESGDADRAARVARERLAKAPGDLGVRTTLALLLTDLRRIQEAGDVLREGLPHAKRTGDRRSLLETAAELALDDVARAVIDDMRAQPESDAQIDAAIAEADWLRKRKRSAEAPKVLLDARAAAVEPVAMVRLAEALESLGDDAAATELYRAAFAKGRTEDIGLRLAWILSRSQKPADQKEALALFRHVWLNAGSPARRVQVEERVLDLAARDGTLADLAIELENEIKDPEAEARDQKRQALVKIYTRARDTVAAAQILTEYSREPGKEIEALLDLARMHLESEEFRAHDRVLRRLIEIDGKHAVDYRQQLAISALERGRPAEARAVIREMLADDAASEVAFEFGAGIFQLAARFDEAVKVYRRSLAMHPDRIETWLLLANALRSANRREQAIGSFQLLLVDDVQDDLFLVAADGLLNMEAPTSALRFAERAVRRRLAEKPDKVYLQRMLQDLLEVMREPEARRRVMLDTVLVGGEQRATFLRELMDEARDAKDWETYVEFGEQLLFLGDELPPSVFLELGEALLKSQQIKAAERAFERARLGTDFAAVERRVADAFEQASRFEDAERVWRRILRRNADDMTATLRVTRLCELRGALPEARGLWLELAQRVLARPAVAGGGDGGRRGGAASAGGGVAAFSSGGVVVQSSGGAAVRSAVALPRAGGRNRNPSDDGPDLAQVVEGYLRCAPESADLVPMWELLATAATAERANAARQAEVAPWLRRIAQVDGTQPARQRLADVEAKLIASLHVPVIRGIVTGRIADGDYDGAEAALVAANGSGLDAERFDLLLARGRADEARTLASRFPAREQVEAVRRLWLIGAKDEARSIVAALAEAKDVQADVLPSWRAAARAIGEVVVEEDQSAARLAQAIANPDAGRRLVAVMSAIRTGTTLDDAAKRDALRRVLPDAEADRTGNQAVQFLAVAEPLLTPAELGPVVERVFANFDNPYLITSRLPWLRLVDDAKQKELLTKAMKAMEGGERNSQLLRMLATDRTLTFAAREFLAQAVRLDGMSPTDRFAFTQLASDSELPPEIGRKLFERTTSLRDDPRSWLLGARYAVDAAERNDRLKRAVAIVASKTSVDPTDLAVVAAVARNLRTANDVDWSSVIAGDADGAALLRAEIAAANGDVKTAASIVLPIAKRRPDDVSMLNKALSWLEQAQDLENAYELMKAHLTHAAQVYPYQRARLAQLCLQTGRAEEVVDLVAGEDAQMFAGSLLLEAAVRIESDAKRLTALRRWQSQQSGIGSARSGAIRFASSLNLLGDRNAGRSLREVLDPVVIPTAAPRTRDEWKRGMDERDLLAFAPEGRAIAEGLLRSLDSAERDAAGPLYRAFVGSAKLRGEGAAVVADALAELQSRPHDAESLRVLFAAAQVGLDVPADVVEREVRRRMAQRRPDLGFLFDALLVAKAKDDVESMRSMLVRLLDRGSLGSAVITPRLPVVFALAREVAPELLLAAGPGGDTPNVQFDGELLAAAVDAGEPAAVREAFRGVGVAIAQPERSIWRERFALPWLGLSLRLGDLDAALLALKTHETWSIGGSGDMFSAAVLGAAVPPIAKFGDAAHWQPLRDALLPLASASDPRGQLVFRVAVLLAVRLKEAGMTAEADALFQELDARRGDVPLLRAWLADGK